MSNFTTPGVYVNEAPLTTFATSPQGQSAAAFFGEARRGPTSPVRVDNWAAYRSLFGELDANSDLGYAVYHYFTNGGRTAWVTRVVSSDAIAAEVLEVPYYPNGPATASASLFTATASSKGTWANNDLTLSVTAGNVPSSDDEFPTFNVLVRYKGVEVERWTEVSADPNGARFIESVVNRYSSYIRVSGVSTAPPNSALFFDTEINTFTGGFETPPTDSDYVASFDKIDAITSPLLLNAVGKSSQLVVSNLLTKAGARGDSFVIIDPPSDAEDRADIESAASQFIGVSSPSYGAMYAPNLLMVDPTKTGIGALRNTFPGGAVAGLFVRTEVERTVAKAPAGYASEIRGAFGTAFALTDSDVGTLYSFSPPVNTFKPLAGAGIVVNGARTLTKRSPDVFINVRRTLNFLKVNLKTLTEFAVFENNDERLWIAINSRLSNFLNDFWQSGGLKGRSAADAFFITCDSTNNTPATIDQGIVNVEVGVALQYPAEFIVIRLSQWAGGSELSENT
jgi:hypothetical protein